MRVIFVNRYFHPDRSATSQMLTDLAFALAGAGRTVHVITGDERIDDPRAHLPRSEVVGGVVVRRLRGTRLGRHSLLARAVDTLAFHLGAARALLGLARRGDVVVAQTDPPLICVTASLVARVRGARLVNWLHDLFPEIAERLGVAGLGGAPGRALVALRDRALERARVNVAIGARMADAVRARGIDPARIRVVHNWCDGEAIAPASAAGNPLRERWGVADRFVIMYSGNMGRAHAFDGLLDAAAQLAVDTRFAFVLIGGGPRRAEVEARVRAGELANVVLLPAQPREVLASSLAAADVHVVSLLPELEGCVVPSKIYGAMAAGRPVLALGDGHGEAARIVAEAGCGECVSAGDGAGVAAALRRLADDPGACVRLGAAARRAFDSHYSAPRAYAEWGQVIDAAAGEVARP